MLIRPWISAAIAAALFVTAGTACKDDDSAPSTPKAAEPETDNGTDAEEPRDRARSEFVRESREKIAALERQIDELEEEVQAAGADADEDLRARLEAIRELHGEISADLDHAGEVVADRWDVFKRDVGASIDDLEDGYNRALEALKTDRNETQEE